MMRAGTFERGKSWRALAQSWHTSPVETRRITAEASRRVVAERFCAGSAPRDYAVTKIRRALAMAQETGDAKAMVSAIHEHNLMHALHAPKRVDATVASRDLSDEEARERIIALMPELVGFIKP